MDFVQSASGGLVIAIAGYSSYLGLLLWTRRPHHRDRRLAVAAATGTAILVFLANVMARALGWWDSWVYALPLTVQVGILLMGVSIFLTFLLGGYRWLVAHSQRPLLWYGLILVVVFAPLTVFGDWYNIERGKMSFGGGYTIWQDVLLGQAFFWLPVLFYRLLLRWYPQTSGLASKP